MKNFGPVRGTYDYLPKTALFREQVRKLILDNYINNGYYLINTPILEHLEFLNNSEGGDNLKLMFKTIKRKDKLDLGKENLTEADIVAEGLRYDLTVPLARFYSNNRETLPYPFKSIQIDYAYRAERPQKGRNRQFIQCDIDVFGNSNIDAEIDLLKTSFETYEKLGFDNLILKVSSREILNDVILYSGFLKDEINSVSTTLDKLDKISVTGVMMELIDKGFDTEKINRLIEAINDIVKNGITYLSTYTQSKTLEDLKYFINTLDEQVNDIQQKSNTRRYKIEFDISIVRGQSYYTGMVFEMYTEGFSGAIGGGGRYDKMVEKITGIDCPAVGFSIGFEPVVMLLEENKKSFNTKQSIALIYDVDDDIVDVFRAKDKLKEIYTTSTYQRQKNMKSFYDKIASVADAAITFKDYKTWEEQFYFFGKGVSTESKKNDLEASGKVKKFITNTSIKI